MRFRVKEALASFLGRKGMLGGAGMEAGEILEACLSYLATSKAGVVIANLEDLYLETEPQNVPGTWKERPNWLRKAKHGIEEIRENPQVLRILRELDRLRKEEKKRRSGVPGQAGEPIREEVG